MYKIYAFLQDRILGTAIIQHLRSRAATNRFFILKDLFFFMRTQRVLS